MGRSLARLSLGVVLGFNRRRWNHRNRRRDCPGSDPSYCALRHCPSAPVRLRATYSEQPIPLFG
jgi:hypothetical protein